MLNDGRHEDQSSCLSQKILDFDRCGDMQLLSAYDILFATGMDR